MILVLQIQSARPWWMVVPHMDPDEKWGPQGEGEDVAYLVSPYTIGTDAMGAAMYAAEPTRRGPWNVWQADTVDQRTYRAQRRLYWATRCSGCRKPRDPRGHHACDECVQAAAEYESAAQQLLANTDEGAL